MLLLLLLLSNHFIRDYFWVFYTLRILYTVYSMHCLFYTLRILYRPTEYSIHYIFYILRIQYTAYRIYCVFDALRIFYSLRILYMAYSIYCIFYIWRILYTAYSIYSVFYILYILNTAQFFIYLSLTFCLIRLLKFELFSVDAGHTCDIWLRSDTLMIHISR